MYDVMTQADRLAEFDRQFSLVQRGQSDTAVCPWCGVISHRLDYVPEDGDCCAEFENARAARGDRQFQSVLAQRNGIVARVRDSIECPYCGGINREELSLCHPADWKRPMVSPYCCDLFQIAVVAIVQREHTAKQINKIHRIEEGIAKAERN